MPEEPTITVLIVDRDPRVRAGLKDALSNRAGIEVRVCADADRLDPDFLPDVAVVELGLRGGHAIRTARAIAARDPRSRVLMHAQLTNGTALLATVMAGAWGLVEKSLDLERLIRAVRRTAAAEPLLDRATIEAVEARLFARRESLEAVLGGIGPPLQIAAALAEGRRDPEIAAFYRVSLDDVRNGAAGLFELMRA